MPTGTSNADHLMPSTKAPNDGGAESSSSSKPANPDSLEVVGGSLASTNSFSKLLELGEAATANTPSSSHKDSGGLSPSLQVSLIRAAQEDLARLFGIPEGAKAFEDNMLTIAKVPEGEFISKEGEIQPVLYYVLSGAFVITQMPSVAGPVSLSSLNGI